MGEWAALGPFIKIIEFFTGVRERRDDRIRAALSALGAALTETRLYLRDLERGGKKVRKREDNLVRLWGKAANALRGLDSRLATTCQYKADYWLAPDEWSELEVREKGIAIDRVYETYGFLLAAPNAKLDKGIS